MLSYDRTSDIWPPKRRRTGVRQDCRSAYPVRWSEEIPPAGISSLPSSESSWGRPNSSSSGSTTKRVTKTPCPNQDWPNRAARDTMELSRWKVPPRGEVINKKAPSKCTGGGGADWKRSLSPPVIQTPRGGRADQTRGGDGKHPNKTNKPNRVMEQTPIKIYADRWTPPPSHVGLAEGHIRPLQPLRRGC